MTRLILLINFAFIPFFTFSQSFWGLQNSKSSGIFGLDLQPASNVGQSPNIDIKLGGISAQLHNNFIGIRTTNLYDRSFLNANEETYQMMLPTNFNGKSKSFYLNADVDLPGISIKLSPKSSISLTGRLRNFFNLDGLEEPGARFAYEMLNTEEQYGTIFNNDNFRIGLLSYAEFALGFGHEIYNEGPHVLKVGGRVKLLAGLASAYLYTRNLEYSFDNDHIVNVHNVDVAYRHGTILEQIDPNFNLRTDWGGIRFENLGVGLDLGGIYEYRPDGDGYKFKLGVSVLDLGGIKFNQSTFSQDFSGMVTGFDLDNLQGNGVVDFDSTLQAEFTYSSNTDQFQVALPSAISIQADIRVSKRFYVGIIPIVSIGQKRKPNRVHNMTGLYVSPRLEGKGWGVGLPLSYVANRGPAMGFTVSAGPFIAGTSNLLAPLFGEQVRSLDLHLGFRAPIGIKKKIDTDNDGIPDQNDDCPEIAGLVYLNGCPEPEKLALESKKEKKDEIIESVPQEKPTEPENSAEDEKRLEELMKHENQLKEAAKEEAIKEEQPKNPELKIEELIIEEPKKEESRIEEPKKVELNIDEPKKEEPKIEAPKKVEFEIEEPKKEETSSIPPPKKFEYVYKSTQPLENLKNGSFETVYFETAKSSLTGETRYSLNGVYEYLKNNPATSLKILGHADTVGPEDYNETLSRRRSEAVKNYLTARGIAEERLIIEYLGESTPIENETSEEARKRNRRVELELIKL